ncbi:RtcB family protein [Natronincola ferrireducens]|uniref:3'-phosphate/5'-hydroxy nucleic acid ligase n=1 Tax=Natronincola ferrireducens TaxID=393762 RepID=A0A1G9ECF6_9FIRM|nr:RtcB family protein [Natronincola ferrireducens]SDK73751.1 RNA-splicing ligase RtcB, repairs tRNA damage [Natronincola ferrireducens]
MVLIKGKYNEAKVFTSNLEKETAAQIEELCNQEFVKDSKIRVMPDTHAGKGCTIGTTMTIQDKVVPNLVGVDIGCGLEVIKIKERELNLKFLDKTIYDLIPVGFNIRKTPHPYSQYISFQDLKCKKHVDISRAVLSVGTLGGGNHFIEANKDEKGNIYIVVHSGSRNLGKQVAEYYQQRAYEELANIDAIKQEIITKLKAECREKEIKKELKKLKISGVDKALAYLQKDGFHDYLHDMKIVQQYAVYNRKAILDEIVNRMNVTVVDQFTTIHNYIDLETMILRKGAISAKLGEKVIIPMNMRDGSLICMGKGNPDWNCSAPHGAGRLMSRTRAKEVITLEKFKESMEGIYTTSVKKSTIDEAAMAYKPMDEIINNIKNTVDILHIIKPIYNFKA